MAAKKSTPPPIDRPLSKAYLRKFTGWSNDYPPGQSDPASLRIMDNVWVNRNGALAVRPGLRQLNYTNCPGTDPLLFDSTGWTEDLPVVGTLEPFYLNDGKPALLYAVRETDGRVGFRAVLLMGVLRTIATLAECGFDYDPASVPFSARTSYVHYVQIDNTIIALSDAGEPARYFYAGLEKRITIPQEITVPAWNTNDKPTIVHPDAPWIVEEVKSRRENLLLDPAFEYGAPYWTAMPGTRAVVTSGGLEIESLPTRTNMINSPLHDVDATGTAGWHSTAFLSADGPWLRLESAAAEETSLRASRILGIEPGSRYKIAFDLDFDATLPDPEVRISFHSCSGSVIGYPQTLPVTGGTARYESPGIRAPEGSVSATVELVGTATSAGQWFLLKNVVLCLEDEPSTAFHGGFGSFYFWTGTPNLSPSVYHPDRTAGVHSVRISAKPQLPYTFLVSASADSPVVADVEVETLKTDGTVLSTQKTSPVIGTTASTVSTTRVGASQPDAGRFVKGRVKASLARGRRIVLAQAQMEAAPGAGLTLFHGSTVSTDPTVTHEWTGVPHLSTSTRTQVDAAKPQLAAETPTADTLVSSDAAKNTYKMAFFYTFENEVGETPPSQVAEIRVQRGWSQWLWKMPDANGKPVDATADPDMCADQLVVSIPPDAFDTAVQQGARRWVLYAMSWSDQEAVPVTGERIGEREFYPDPLSRTQGVPFYANLGWIAVTPQRLIGLDFLPVPNGDEPNMTRPLRFKYGAAISDRLIMAGDPVNPASILWSSNQPGRYTMFSPATGGGEKVLSSGNLRIPHSVVLWQNPQSVDSIAILCTSDSELSTSYYMAPAQFQSQGAGSATVFGFEETTNTPGSKSAYAVEVLNNALYRPTDTSLLKSTAANYNISHKNMSEQISQGWGRLIDKQSMTSEQLDSRLYFLVHNPAGELLRKHNLGNEVWVLDTAAEQGHWSRFTVQGSALKVVVVGDSTFLAITGDKGIRYFDPSLRLDHDPVLGWAGRVFENPIPWEFETNLQGANRAHDAWAHLQQVSLTSGNFIGEMEWGIRGYSMHGKGVDARKRTVLLPPDTVPPDHRLSWGYEDQLLVRRDLKEWTFWGRSIPNRHGTGSIELVQYRYTPTTVNIGYEHGSVETQEYGQWVPGVAWNGVPRPAADSNRSWGAGSTDPGPGSGTWRF